MRNGSDSREYHHRRWQEEIERARASADRKAADAHRELARLYSEKIGIEPPPEVQSA